jgi:hypothetical protein
MVYSHQHFAHVKVTAARSIKRLQPVQTVTDKCDICDMMNHTHMAIFYNGAISPLVTICNTHYTRQHNYKGIALILAAGRAPPIA